MSNNLDASLRLLLAFRPDEHTRDDITEAASWLHKSHPVVVRAVLANGKKWQKNTAHTLGTQSKKQVHAYFESVVKKTFTEAKLPSSAWDSDYACIEKSSSDAAALVAAAKEFKADVIVLGASDTAPKGRYRAGSTAEALIESSPVPLLLVPRETKFSKSGLSRITCAIVDHTPQPKILTTAADAAHNLGLPLRIVAFGPEETHSTGGKTVAGLIDLDGAMPEDSRERALMTLDRARTILGEHCPDLDIHTCVALGTNWSTALDQVKWKKSDVLIAGLKPSSTLERMFKHAHSTSLIRHTRVPLIVYPTTF